MMISDFRRPHPTVQIPQWEPPEDPTATINLSASPSSTYFAGAHSPQASSEYSPSSFAADYVAALHRYLPSNDFNKSGYELESDPDSDLPLDSFASDEFRMYEFKVRGCERGRSHDWTECPFAHPGEKARRRDPRLYHYSGIACPDFRKGSCKRGDACEFSHGVFECWLHPTRYRTQPCKDGRHCKRRVCFFAHSPDQIRLLSDSPSPRRLAVVDSPPTSPPSYRSKPHSLSELVERVRALQIRDRNLSLNPSSCSWGLQLGAGSPRNGSNFGCSSLPSTSTPVGAPVRLFDAWNPSLEEEPPMERVESGKNLRAAMYAKLRKENSLDPVPDFGWVSELVK